MSFEIDTSLHWTEHFVRYGFAVLRDQIDQDYLQAALERLRERVSGEAKHLPFDAWTIDNVGAIEAGMGDPVLDTIYRQPRVRNIVDIMFGTAEAGSPNGWSGKPDYQIFIRPFDPDYRPRPLRGGHIDFGGNIIPLFGDAFVIQVALRDTEPFGGNITVIPGSHKIVQQWRLRDPDIQYPYDFTDFPFGEPYEFVAKAGDILLMHHLMFHEGNPCGGARRPRLALHLQAQRSTFLTEADPDNCHGSPWIQSFTLNGKIGDPDDRQRYLDFCARKKGLWGYWRSDDNALQYKIYTGRDGTLHAKTMQSDGQEYEVENARFDGRCLTFQQRRDGESLQTSVQVNDLDPRRLIATVQKDAGPPVRLEMRRVREIAGRLSG